jgi:hypothetical protein
MSRFAMIAASLLALLAMTNSSRAFAATIQLVSDDFSGSTDGTTLAGRTPDLADAADLGILPAAAAPRGSTKKTTGCSARLLTRRSSR